MIKKAFDKGSRIIFDNDRGYFFTDINNILCIEDLGEGYAEVTLFTSAGDTTATVKCTVQEYIDFVDAEVKAQIAAEEAERFAAEGVKLAESGQAMQAE